MCADSVEWTDQTVKFRITGSKGEECKWNYYIQIMLLTIWTLYHTGWVKSTKWTAKCNVVTTVTSDRRKHCEFYCMKLQAKDYIDYYNAWLYIRT